MNIRHNIPGLTTQRYQSSAVKKQSKTLEKLSSGYRINSAADDAAVLSVSQKMRAQIIGYERGEQNAAEGIGFLQTADGAMLEVASMMNRMKELTMEALNGTCTDEDRTLIEAEFEQLQTEVDRVLKGSKYNGIPLFEQHKDTYYSISGNRKWPYDLLHKIDNTNNGLDLTVSDGSIKYKVSITVPEGIYTTQELTDEIDDALRSQASSFPGFNMEFDSEGIFHFHYEDGTMIDEVGGGLSYLLYDSYDGQSYGMLLGTTQFEAGWPLSVTYNNNELKFSIEDYFGNSQQVKLYIPPDDYSKEEMIEYINGQLERNGFTDVKASEYGSKCIQIGGNGYLVTGLKGNMFEIDDGIKYTSVFYDNTKYGTIYNTKGYIDGQAYITTDPTDTLHNRVEITAANDTLKIDVDGSGMKSIQLTQGSFTMGEIVNQLNQAFTDQGIGAKASVRRMGGFESLTITSDLLGKNSSIGVDTGSSAYQTLFCHTEYYQRNDIKPQDGYYLTIEPSLTGAAVLSFPISIDSTNNQLNLLVDSAAYSITIADGTYANISDLLTALNQQFAAAGPSDGSDPKLQAVNVSGAIQITTTGKGGDISSVKFGLPPGSAYDSLFSVTRQVPVWVYKTSNGAPGKKPEISLDYPMNNSNVIDSSNDTFCITINGKYKEIKIPHNTYTPEELADLLTKKFPPSKEIIPNSFGTLTSVGREELQEGSTVPSRLEPASVTLPFGLDEVTVIDGSNQEFKLKVNGIDETITLAHGSYSRDGLIAEINQKFAASGIGVTASREQNSLKLTTTALGKKASLEISSASGGAMDVLAGTRDISISGLTFTIVDKKLVITGNDEGAGTSLVYNGGGSSSSLFTGTKTEKINATVAGRITKEAKSYIQGVALAEPVTITAANKELEFTYDAGAGPITISLTLDEKDYALDDLAAELGRKIDDQLNNATPPLTNHLKVTVDRKGVKIEAASSGSQYKLSGFSGSFHAEVISGSHLISKDYQPNAYIGQQIVTPAYIVGRQDVRNKPVRIQSGINDTLKLDFSFPDQSGVTQDYTLELILPPGSYSGKRLSDMLQQKVSDALAAEGMSTDLITVDIGGISTGVIGSDDSNSLNFTLNTDKLLNPGNGQCKIDGVRGTAAFAVFYKTEGEPKPAYMIGSKDLTKGTVIPAGKNDFSFRISGKQVNLLIPPGSYTADGLITVLNQCLKDQNIPVAASLEDKYLKLSFTNLGKNKITDISGGARGLIFFEENGRIGEDTSLTLQIGPDSQDEFKIKKEIVNTCFLKINSLCITNKNYATKTLSRLDGAIGYLGSSQGAYGAYSNRLEHVINANAATRENLTTSESRMRDADMAKEMMEQVKSNILVQSSQAMMAQANRLGEGILQLLQ